MSEFKQYNRKEKAELRPVTQEDILEFQRNQSLLVTIDVEKSNINVSISQEDLSNGSPKLGDMIARNPKNHKDQWLVAEEYFKNNFEL